MENAKFQWKFGISLHTINIELQNIFYQVHFLYTSSLENEERRGEGCEQMSSLQKALSYLQKDDTDKRSHNARLFLLGITPML
jgi:hypothetical protein